ncbi:MAG TPA: hypothetical protein VHX14_11940 [Thermoanaerobaculia bacterium]|nr:hypothetical protein [Thermoanaerobaculia bacterium]
MKYAMFVAALLLAGCGTMDAKMTMKLTSDGGFTGKGVGGVSIDGTSVDASDMRRTCRGTLRSEEGSRLRELAKAARPETWPESYASAERPHGSPDQIRYTITANAHSTSWYGEAGERVPHEILALRDALDAVQQRVLKDCP